MTIREAIIKIIEDGQNFEVYSKICKVDSIDSDLNTCEASPIDGDAQLLDVKLTATEGNQKGFIVIPEVGSNVIVTFIDKDTSFVSMCTEIESVVFNGGSNGGLINIETLISELGKNNLILEAIKNIVSSPIPEAGNGAPSALGQALNGAISALEVGDFENMEDESIKH
jgi:hypothetical protein